MPMGKVITSIITDVQPQPGQTTTSVTTSAQYYDQGNLTQLVDPDRGTSTYWLQWQDTLAYEREVDRKSGLNTFLSDERTCVPFAYTNDDWCFDRSRQNSQGECPILFWSHEL
ncbi:hypothetical protein KSD_20900 [Ktedonobacter sp. SOSP1-85]|uniref:hypothetical protein n=1 Tax=Ktedonobacter sp. SOSP1-85 TaxID=2778367 RepID=UPI0019169660|nr:hypothetical protein [Ktedonobacter sp. SOSP1-85]GHO74319.1 hypothetical protein KSD_20900 [Ktedonobacter sp. SOSP1-85]